MAEYVPGPDADLQAVAQQVLAHAGERAGEVQYVPRANTRFGAFVAPDDVLDGFQYSAPNSDEGSTKTSRRSAKTASQEG